MLDGAQLRTLRDEVLCDPPASLPLSDELHDGLALLYVADMGTAGLGGPTRADRAGIDRDFVDFVRNIGQPPDKDLGGGSFGYGKAAFYIASRARTILIDTLCLCPDGAIERRFIGCGLGESFDLSGRPFTGRHWWGRMTEGVPEPLTGSDADNAARCLGFPDRTTHEHLGTTVAIISPSVSALTDSGEDATMSFIADSLVWNFWPRMIDSPGGTQRSMSFRLLDQGVAHPIPDPRTHQRLRGFVEAMDRLREDPDEGADDEFVIDRIIQQFRPARTLGRMVVQKGIVAPLDTTDRPLPQGARQMTDWSTTSR